MLKKLRNGMNMKLKDSKINTKRYKIMTILHSGRKGTRYTMVNNEKYDGLINYTVVCKDLHDLKPYECLKMKVKNSPFYRTWETTPVICLYQNVDTYYYCETVNSIYVLKELDEIESKVITRGKNE